MSRRFCIRTDAPGPVVRVLRPSRYTQISVFHNLEKQLQASFRDHLLVRYGIETDVAIEQPKQSAFGELALPIAFQLAKTLKQPPRKIAEELISDIGAIPGFSAPEIAGNGYINARFDRGAYGASLLHPPAEAAVR